MSTTTRHVALSGVTAIVISSTSPSRMLTAVADTLESHLGTVIVVLTVVSVPFAST